MEQNSHSRSIKDLNLTGRAFLQCEGLHEIQFVIWENKRNASLNSKG